MALRFFGRRRDDQEDDIDRSGQGNEQPPAEPARPRRRRGRAGVTPADVPEVTAPPAPPTWSRPSGGRSRRRKPQADSAQTEPVPQPPPQPEPATAAQLAPARRRRRRPRGGEDRNHADEAAPATPAPARPAAEEPRSPIEALLARETALLDAFATEQLTVLRNVSRSLATIENRLGSLERPTTVTALPRVAIFVDVPNVVYAAERFGVSIDFGKLRDMLSRGREMVRAAAYAPISDDPQARLETQRFVQPFVGHGYRIVTKPLKRYADGSMKANFDVELAIDILTMSDRLDIVSLVSGDGDFRRLVDLVASKGVRVEVVAFGQSMSAELRAVADEYIDLAAHLEYLRIR